MQIVRSVLAVLAGIVTVVALSEGIDFLVVKLGLLSFSGPELTVPFAIATVYRSIAAVAGGFVTAKLAPSKAMMHVIVLGAIAPCWRSRVCSQICPCPISGIRSRSSSPRYHAHGWVAGWPAPNPDPSACGSSWHGEFLYSVRFRLKESGHP